MSLWAPTALTSIASALLALPLVPAVRELRRPKDAAALPIQQHDANIDSFARAFRRYIGPLHAPLIEVMQENKCRDFVLADRSRAVLDGRLHDELPVRPEATDAVTLFGHPVLLQDDSSFTRELYAAGNLCSGRHNLFRAVLADGDVYLGEASRVLRWIHAEGQLRAASGCVLHGRASAGTSILLAPGCVFERMHAGAIVFGTEFVIPEGPPFAPGSTIDRRLGRFRIRGELRLRAGEVLQGNLIARCIRISEECNVVGSLKAAGEVIIEAGTRVDGTIVAGASVRIGDGCSIRGPIVAEGGASVGRNTQIGSPEVPSTISAPRIRIASGSVLHGTAWARSGGRVEA